MTINNTDENKINKAILLKEGGKSASEIMEMFPEIKDELSEIFSIADVLSKKGESIKAPEESLNKILYRAPKQNRTESILRLDEKRISQEKNEIYQNSIYNKGRSQFNILNLITNRMNKKMALSMAVLVLMLVFAIGGSIALKNKRVNNANNQNLAFEKEITDEKDSFEKDASDLNELADDNSADEIGDSLANIDKEVDNASNLSASELELYEKELAYEIDIFSSDVESTSGIESDTSLNAFSSDLGGI